MEMGDGACSQCTEIAILELPCGHFTIADSELKSPQNSNTEHSKVHTHCNLVLCNRQSTSSLKFTALHKMSLYVFQDKQNAVRMLIIDYRLSGLCY